MNNIDSKLSLTKDSHYLNSLKDEIRTIKTKKNKNLVKLNEVKLNEYSDYNNEKIKLHQLIKNYYIDSIYYNAYQNEGIFNEDILVYNDNNELSNNLSIYNNKNNCQIKIIDNDIVNYFYKNTSDLFNKSSSYISPNSNINNSENTSIMTKSYNTTPYCISPIINISYKTSHNKRSINDILISKQEDVNIICNNINNLNIEKQNCLCINKEKLFERKDKENKFINIYTDYYQEGTMNLSTKNNIKSDFQKNKFTSYIQQKFKFFYKINKYSKDKQIQDQLNNNNNIKKINENSQNNKNCEIFKDKIIENKAVIVEDEKNNENVKQIKKEHKNKKIKESESKQNLNTKINNHKNIKNMKNFEVKVECKNNNIILLNKKKKLKEKNKTELKPNKDEIDVFCDKNKDDKFGELIDKVIEGKLKIYNEKKCKRCMSFIINNKTSYYCHNKHS